MKPLCYDYLNCPTTFSTYDDFNKKFRITRPESFNFAYDVADRIAQEESRLQAAKLSSAKFFDSARELCQKQLQTLDTIMKATGSEAVKPEAIRIPKEQPAPVSEPTPADSGNTQVFNFIKDEI